MNSDVQDLFDGHIDALAQQLTALSANSRNERSEFRSPAAHQDFQRRIEATILVYLELRCGCGRSATAGNGLCEPCRDAMIADVSPMVETAP